MHLIHGKRADILCPAIIYIRTVAMHFVFTKLTGVGRASRILIHAFATSLPILEFAFVHIPINLRIWERKMLIVRSTF